MQPRSATADNLEYGAEVLRTQNGCLLVVARCASSQGKLPMGEKVLTAGSSAATSLVVSGEELDAPVPAHLLLAQ